MTITKSTAAADYASMVPELDSIDANFLAWEWTQAMTEYPTPTEDTLSVEEAAHYGII